LPLFHATDYTVAKQICASGYTALSSLDSGYYGKGIYFSSSILYSMVYLQNKTVPAILLTYVTPGNAFPVIEDFEEKKNFIGKAIKTGYNAHYVLTTSDGHTARSKVDPYFDELVIEQEGQALPAFIVTIGQENISQIVDELHQANSAHAVSPRVPGPPKMRNFSLPENSESSSTKQQQRPKPRDGRKHSTEMKALVDE